MSPDISQMLKKEPQKLIHSQDWKIRISTLLHLAQSSCSHFEHLQTSAKELLRNNRDNSGLSNESHLYTCITRKVELKKTFTSLLVYSVFGTGGAPHLQLVDGRFKICVKSWQVNPDGKETKCKMNQSPQMAPSWSKFHGFKSFGATVWNQSFRYNAIRLGRTR